MKIELTLDRRLDGAKCIDPVSGLNARSRRWKLALVLALAMSIGWAPGAMADNHELQQVETFLGIMTKYFSVIDSVYNISRDAEKSAIHQMHKMQEVFDDRGEKAKIVGVLRDVLRETDNPTVRNAAYMMLGDVLKDTGQSDAAIESLRAALNENLERVK